MTEGPILREAFYLSIRLPCLSKLNYQPVGMHSRLVRIVNVLMLHKELSASPLKPRLFTAKISLNSVILEVVPRLATMLKSSSDIPQPLSVTSNPYRPYPVNLTSICVA